LVDVAKVAFPPPGVIQVGEWRIEPDLDRVVRNGDAIKLEPRVMRLLVFLAANAGRNVTVDELLENVWRDVVVGPDSVYQAMGVLRRALGDDHQNPTYIAQVPRKGYRLIAPVATTPGPEVPVGRASLSITSAMPVTVPPTVRAWPYRWRLVAASAGVIALALGGWHLVQRADSRVGLPTVAGQGATRPSLLPAARSVPSVAVLPFLDLTEKHDLEYFADGMTEELIDLLARKSDIHVPARTSSFYFKDKNATIAEIAAALQVSAVLEGSVRRSGNKIRVTAQLIQAADGYHLWSGTYDRDLSDTFAVEDDIARAVVRIVQARLLATDGRYEVPAGNPAAHNLLLQCQFYVRRNTPTDAEKAVDCFRRLVSLDPVDPFAWSGYADALLRQPLLNELPIADVRHGSLAARDAAAQALSLNPALPAAHATLANFHRLVDRDLVAAEAELEAALAADPTDPTSLLAAAGLARDLGQPEKVIELCRRAQLRDPLNFQPYARSGLTYLYLGHLTEAEAAARKRLDLAPEGIGGHVQLAFVMLARGDPRAALNAVEQEPDLEMQLVGRSLAYHALGQRADSDAALDELRRRYGRRYLTEIAWIYAYRGETDKALDSLDQAYAANDPGVLGIKGDVLLKPLHGERRYAALLHKLNLPE